MRLLARFQSEEGQALAEYGLILALIAVVCIVAAHGPRPGCLRQPGEHSRRNAVAPSQGPDVMRVPRGADQAPPLQGPSIRPSGPPAGRGGSSAISGISQRGEKAMLAILKRFS